jgi:hypothetical protein
LGNLEGVTGAVDEYPAISAIGYVVSAMITYEPWMVEVGETYPNMRGEMDIDDL